ncbi:MAG: hypothetical protein EPO52_00065 [Herbiconiux sp.]|uniref:S8 family serine peptidase n=1 Tax=Herbiconiux sp. TaxID=1871186 RepID=UPI0011FFA082|nr:S8 family serine peptidase [Herbiconiux sp.]TAJ50257.1 MAG: hypothetical protein EPO52_00065 [Herbiconiux sp.]
MRHDPARTDARRRRSGAGGGLLGRAAGGTAAMALVTALLMAAGLALPTTAHADPESPPPANEAPTADISGLSDRLDALTDLAAGTDPGSDSVAAELGVAADGQGSLQVEQGGVAVSILYSERPDDADFQALAELATVVATSSELARASAYVVPSNLDAVAALPRVASVTEALKAGTAADAGAPASSALASELATAVTPALTPALTTAANPAGASAGLTSAAATPSVAAPTCRTVEAVGQAPLRADLAAATYGVDGTGVTVGIISDSYATSPTAHSTPAQDVAAGLLPGPGNPCGYEQPVTVVSDNLPETTVDEGRGMAQVVHSIAPGATIAFATVGIDELTMHDAILALKAAGATVIVDDIYLFTEPFFQQGPVGVAIDTVQKQGVTYLSSAGNYNNIGDEGYPSAGYALNGWQTDAYRPTTCPAGVLTAMGAGTFDCMDFDQTGTPDATATLTLGATSAPVTYALQWAEPSGFAKGTFVLAVTDDHGVTTVLDRGNGNLPVTAAGFRPVTDGDYDFSIVRDLSAGASAEVTPALKWVWAFHSDIVAAEYFGAVGHDRVGLSISGHTGLRSVVSVAALPSDDPTTAELFSSAGPVTQYFDYDPSVSPVPQPFAEPLSVAKPDLAGVDRILTNFFSSSRPVDDRPGVYSFWGTSAAAPSVAAVVALGRQYSPTSTPAELRSALGSTTAPAFSPTPTIPDADVVGTGRVDAAAFLAALPAPTHPNSSTDVATTGADARLAATGSEPVAQPFALALAAVLVGLVGVALRRRARKPGTTPPR